MLRERLNAIAAMLPARHQLPIDPRVEVGALIVEKCRVMSSAKVRLRRGEKMRGEKRREEERREEERRGEKRREEERITLLLSPLCATCCCVLLCALCVVLFVRGAAYSYTGVISLLPLLTSSPSSTPYFLSVLPLLLPLRTSSPSSSGTPVCI